MKQQCIVYRTGGTERFQWRRTIPLYTQEDVDGTLTFIQRMGYHAFVEDFTLSTAIGLPETYDARPLMLADFERVVLRDALKAIRDDLVRGTLNVAGTLVRIGDALDSTFDESIDGRRVK